MSGGVLSHRKVATVNIRVSLSYLLDSAKNAAVAETAASGKRESVASADSTFLSCTPRPGREAANCCTHLHRGGARRHAALLDVARVLLAHVVGLLKGRLWCRLGVIKTMFVLENLYIFREK